MDEDFKPKGCLGCLIPFILYGVPMFAIGTVMGHRSRADVTNKVKIVHVAARPSVRPVDGVLTLGFPSDVPAGRPSGFSAGDRHESPTDFRVEGIYNNDR
jgi:hypothetical protein